MEKTNRHAGHGHIETELSRDLGLTTALAIGIGTMIAAGIFSLSGLAIRNVGSAAILSFLLAAVVATFTALTYCEFVSIYPRTGEGYLYARKTYTPPLAYFVGWALFLGYTSSCAFYIATFSEYFNEFIWHSPIEALSGIIMLIGLTLLNIKGTEESGAFQIVVTAAKVILLVWFVAGGLSYVDVQGIVDKFSTDVAQIGSTAAMVFITFFGFSAIAASAGEVKDPVKNIPRAIFISMAVVTVLYTAVIVVLLFAGLEEYTEAAMGEAAKKFLGSVGGYVIIFGGLFSMISASNASIMAGSRVTLSMGQLGHLPKELGVINSKTRTPIVSVILVGGTIMIFCLLLPLEKLAHFADTVLLTALILVNAALIVHRRKYPDIERPFKVPLVPLLPAIGIIANIGLIAQIGYKDPLPFVGGFATLFLGMLGFLAWKGTQSEEEAIPGTRSRVALGRYATDLDEKRFRVLVPVANPNSVPQLLSIAASVAGEQNGEIVLMRAVALPDQVAPAYMDDDVIVEKEREVLDMARNEAQKYGLPVTSLIRVGHDVARSILETARERNCNLIVMGWKGYTSTADRIFGEVADAVVTHARCDLMLIKLVGEGKIKRLLLPTAGGKHARAAEKYAASIMDTMNGSVTVCQVQKSDTNKQSTEQVLKEASERIKSHSNNVKVAAKVIESEDVTEGILKEANNYDAVMVGATRDSVYQQVLFGSIPEKITKNLNKTVIVVKHHDPVRALIGRVVGGQ